MFRGIYPISAGQIATGVAANSRYWCFTSISDVHLFKIKLYPLVNIQKTMERSTMLFMGKFTKNLLYINRDFP